MYIINQFLKKQLNEFHKVKDYNNYLVYIFCNLDPKSSQLANEIRVSAGLSLKNNLKYYDKFPDEVKIYIKQQILRTIADPSQNVRKTAGTIISSIARMDILDWPDLIENLTNALDSKDGQLLDGVFLTLSMIFEYFFSFYFFSYFLPIYFFNFISWKFWGRRILPNWKLMCQIE